MFSFFCYNLIFSYIHRDEDWWDNDGALNTISMTHPRIPIEHPSHFVVDDSECQPLQPGIWFVLLPQTKTTDSQVYNYSQKTFDSKMYVYCVLYIVCRYYKIVEGDHILFIVNRERAGVQFDLIYDSIFERCRKHVFKKKIPTLPDHVNQNS